MNYSIGDKMPEKIEKVVNHRAIVFDTEKFEMLKDNIEKIMNHSCDKHCAFITSNK